MHHCVACLNICMLICKYRYAYMMRWVAHKPMGRSPTMPEGTHTALKEGRSKRQPHDAFATQGGLAISQPLSRCPFSRAMEQQIKPESVGLGCFGYPIWQRLYFFSKAGIREVFWSSPNLTVILFLKVAALSEHGDKAFYFPHVSVLDKGFTFPFWEGIWKQFLFKIWVEE